MPSLYVRPVGLTAPEGRGGAGPVAGSLDESADQFAGGMAYIPRSHSISPEPKREPVSAETAFTNGARAANEHTAEPVHTNGSGIPAAPRHAPSTSHRRRRQRRRHGRKRLGPVVAIAGVVAVIGGIIGVGGGYGMVWLMRDSPLITAVSPEEEAERNTFIAACAQTLRTIDCGCLWNDARAAFTPEYRAATLRLIDERRELPVRLQRIRSEKLLGPELAKTVWEATYACARR